MDESNVFIFTIEVVGTIAFAISGIRLAAAKNFDWFGAYVVGLVTAIGGGTLRDVLLAVPVFWMQNSMFLLVTLISLISVIIFRRALVGSMRTRFIFDASSLALFVVVGIEKSFAAGYPEWVAIVMHSSIVFLNRISPKVSVHIRPYRPSLWERVKGIFSKG